MYGVYSPSERSKILDNINIKTELIYLIIRNSAQKYVDQQFNKISFQENCFLFLRGIHTYKPVKGIWNLQSNPKIKLNRETQVSLAKKQND